MASPIGAFFNTFDLHLAIIGLENKFGRHRFTLVLLYECELY